MSVDLRNYVQVNINYHETKPLNRTRDTAILINVNGLNDKNDPAGRLNTHISKSTGKEVDYYVSLEDYKYAIDEYNKTVVIFGDYYKLRDSGTCAVWYDSNWRRVPNEDSHLTGKNLGKIDSDELPDQSTVHTDIIIDTEEDPKLYNYVKCFFSNGGIKLKIIGPTSKTGYPDVNIIKDIITYYNKIIPFLKPE